MKIYQILEFNQFNTGSVHQMFQAAAGLRERGHEVAVVSRPDPVLESKAHAHGVAFHAFAFRHEFDLPTIRGLHRILRRESPDVIHVHKGVAHAVALAATWRHRPGAFVVNRGVSFPLDLWNRGKYRTERVDRIVTVCRQIGDVIVSSGRLPVSKVEVIYAGTDVSEFDPARWDPRAFRRENGIGDERFVLAQVGVRDWKGWKELIDSVSDVVTSHPAVQLLLIGCRSAEDRAWVTDYAREVGMSGHVMAIGTRTDMPNVFASCDAVADASWAGTGITGTVREAMAMEKPVIATDAGGNRELVSSADVGWLVPMKDRAEMTNALREVMTNRERSIEVGRAARRHVVSGFSKELRITRLETLYSNIVEANRRKKDE